MSGVASRSSPTRAHSSGVVRQRPRAAASASAYLVVKIRQAASERAAGPVSPTAPLLHLREPSGRDNPRLLSRRIELFEVGDDIVNLLRIFQAWKSHFGTRYLGLRILDVFAEGCFIPGDAGF